MFHVELHQMTTECQRFKPLIMDWRNQYDEVGQVIRGLSGLTGLDHVVAGLRQEQGMIEVESRDLSKMMEALDSAIRLYDSTEDRIIGNVDGSLVIAKRIAPAPVNVSSVNPNYTDGIHPVIYDGTNQEV